MQGRQASIMVSFLLLVSDACKLDAMAGVHTGCKGMAFTTLAWNAMSMFDTENACHVCIHSKTCIYMRA